MEVSRLASSEQAVQGIKTENIPQELKALGQWVLWRREIREGKSTKIPYQAGEQRAASNDPSTWTTFAEVLVRYQGGGYDGIGFVLTRDDPVMGVDLDHSIDESGTIAPWAMEIIKLLSSYTETSPSGTGIRIFALGSLPFGGRKKGQVEMYDSGRYLTVTGNHLEEVPPTLEERTQELAILHAQTFSVADGSTRPKAPSPSPPSRSCIPEDDELIERARMARNGEKLSRLLAGDWEGYASRSEADFTLCCLLAFWSQYPRQIDRIFRSSGLYRGKWDQRHYGDGRTYGQRVIEVALNTVRDHYSPGRRLIAAAALGRVTRRGNGMRVMEVVEAKRPASSKEAKPWRK